MGQGWRGPKGLGEWDRGSSSYPSPGAPLTGQQCPEPLPPPLLRLYATATRCECQSPELLCGQRQYSHHPRGLQTRTLIPSPLLAPWGPPWQAWAVTHPRAPSKVLWISFRTPAGHVGGGQRPGEASRGQGQTQASPPPREMALVSTPVFQATPPPSPTCLLPAHQLLPPLTLIIEQRVFHDWARPPLWKAEARSGEPWALLCPRPLLMRWGRLEPRAQDWKGSRFYFRPEHHLLPWSSPFHPQVWAQVCSVPERPWPQRPGLPSPSLWLPEFLRGEKG